MGKVVPLKRTHATINTYTEEGARVLAERIIEYWAARGCSVEVRVIKRAFHYPRIVSDLVNGLPPDKQTYAQRTLGKASISAPDNAESAA